MRSAKLDLWIALAALIVSGLTAASALYQSKVFSDQLSATVWPYLSFRDVAGPDSLDLSIENDGAGPAIITGAQLSIAGRAQPSVAAALRSLGLHPSEKMRRTITMGTVGTGVVLRPGASLLVVRLTSVSPQTMAHLQSTYSNVAMNVYYCSLLNRCWEVKLHATERPREITGQNYPHTTVQSE